VHLIDSLEALVQMVLDLEWVLGCAEDVEEVVIGDEVEAREGLSLGL
jgi:hypothetical protein